MHTIDVLLAIYNGAKYLPEQLASLDTQTHSNWRLIVRDDGSDDGSLDIVRDWSARTGRSLVILHDSDTLVGPAESFGRLLARSDAPYFAFCDQDDVWEAEKLTRLMNSAATITSGAVLAHCDLAVVDHELSIVAPSFWEQQGTHEKLRSGKNTHRKQLFIQNPVQGCAMLGNAALRENMLPIPNIVSMHDWWAALSAAFTGEIVAVDQPLVNYRQHGRNSVGARDRTMRSMVVSFLKHPVEVFNRTFKIFDTLEQQSAVALDRYGKAMSSEERKFASDFCQIRDGLLTKGGWWMLHWSLKERRRLPLAMYLISTTFRLSSTSTSRRENQRR